VSGRSEWTTVALMTAAVAVAAAAAAVSVHSACFEAFPFEPPVPGTTRAGYCDALNSTHPWLSLAIVPSIAMLIGGFLLRRRVWLVYLLAALLIAAVVANAVIVNNLEFDPFNGL
jgi:hypothetical protein